MEFLLDAFNMSTHSEFSNKEILLKKEFSQFNKIRQYAC